MDGLMTHYLLGHFPGAGFPFGRIDSSCTRVQCTGQFFQFPAKPRTKTFTKPLQYAWIKSCTLFLPSTTTSLPLVFFLEPPSSLPKIKGLAPKLLLFLIIFSEIVERLSDFVLLLLMVQELQHQGSINQH
jgi:hypothetical protein